MDMKWVFLAALCLVFFCAGCLQQKDGSAQSGMDTTEKLTVTIDSPKAGEILQGNKAVSFEATVIGGKAPLSYRWSSSIDGELSTSRKFTGNPSRMNKGRHVIIFKVTDAAGKSAQGSVQIEVM
jgi:hypothetical protein